MRKTNPLLPGILIVAALFAGRVWVRADDPANQPGVTPINLHLAQTRADGVFQKLSRKLPDVDFTFAKHSTASDKLQDLDITNMPYWAAVFAAADTFGLRLDQPFDRRLTNTVYTLKPVDSMEWQGQTIPKAPICVCDHGFVVAAEGFARGQHVEYAMGSGKSDNAILKLALFVDPATHVVGFYPEMKLDTVVDDLGKSLITPEIKNRKHVGGPSQNLKYDYVVRLDYKDGPATRIADVKGAMIVRVADQMDSFAVDKPLDAGNVDKKFGKLEIVLNAIGPAANGRQGYDVALSVLGDTSGMGDIWELLINAKLVDADGVEFVNMTEPPGIPDMNGNIRPHVGNNWTLTYIHPQPPGQRPAGGGGRHAGGGPPPPPQPLPPNALPAKFSLAVPVGVHAVTLPFEFRDLPLPLEDKSATQPTH